jgi:hypothetical protein
VGARRRASLAGFVLSVSASSALAQTGELNIAIDAPPSLTRAADRLRNIDRPHIVQALARAGLEVPSHVHLTLISENDARARATPLWIAGAAFGTHEVAIFPARVGVYPYGSLESVALHELAHIALSIQAHDEPLPRWFHEGVAISVEQEWGVSSQVRLLVLTFSDPDLPALGRLFESDSHSETARAYVLSAALISDVRQRHGPMIPGAIANRVAAGMSFAQAFELETGDTPQEAATRAWAPYHRWTNWVQAMTSGAALWMGILTLACLAFFTTLRKRARRRRQWDEEHAVDLDR